MANINMTQGQLDSVVTAINNRAKTSIVETKTTAMTKAQFNALAEERKANRAGSGFDEWGASGTPSASINKGLHTWVSSNINYISLGRETESQTGDISKTLYPLANVNGTKIKIGGTALNGIAININRFDFVLPTAPNIYPYDTVLTTEQINSGVIKHADASNSGLIINGKFDTDTSGWTALNATLSIDNGRLKVTNTTTGAGYVYQSKTFVVGKKYIIEFQHQYGNRQGAVRVGTTNIGGEIFNEYSADTTGANIYKQIEFTATATTLYITLVTSDGTIGNYRFFDNIAVYPADAISRSDLVFLESFHEDVSEKNIVYPLGNVQYLGGNTDGLTGIANGAFSGFETYSLFGNWQTPSALIGKGYVWSSLTEAQKKAFIANPDNNCYLDGDKVIQVRYRVRVVQGWGDDWATIDPQTSSSQVMNYSSVTTCAVAAKGKKATLLYDLGDSSESAFYYGAFHSSGLGSTGSFIAGKGLVLVPAVAYEGKCFALPIALVHRRNSGAYNNVYNPNGTKKASDGKFWYETTETFTSISDCFNPSKLLTESGYIGTVSGRPDGLFYDQVHESDILDLRNSSKKAEDYNRLIGREFNKLVGGTYRGKEGEWGINKSFGSGSFFLYDYDDGRVRFYTYDSKMNLQIGDTIQVVYFNGTNYIADRVEVLSLYLDSTYSFLGRCPNISAAISSGATASNGIKFFMYSNKTTRTKSNTLLHCDIIGNPANYPTSWKESGVFGTPLIVAEDGTSLLPDGTAKTIKLSRKVSGSLLLALKSLDGGITWASGLSTNFNASTNSITRTFETNIIELYFYITHTNMAVPTVNSEVLEVGDSFLLQQKDANAGVDLEYSLIAKVGVSGGGFEILSRITNYTIFSSNKIYGGDTTRLPKNITFTSTLTTTSPTVKVFPYLTRTNGKAYLNLVFKEMKHNGTSWGDDNKFNIVDGVSTTTDNNAQTVLIGQKKVELPYFIGADE